jgi:hypothetical protein
LGGDWRRVALISLGLGAVALAASCGGNPSDATPAATSASNVGKQPPPRLELAVFAVGQDFGVGKNRLPIAVLLQDGVSVNDRVSDLEVSYALKSGGDSRRLEPVVWRAWPVLNGVYVGSPVFDRAGIWEFSVTLNEGGRRLHGTAAVNVKERPSAPSTGDAAPAAPTKTASSPEQLRQITSAPAPDPDLYRISLDQAVKSGRPVVATFSTPAFCATQTCGPQLDVMSRLQDRYGDRAHFIHVEIWDNPREMLDSGNPSVGRVSPAVSAWKLESEPWTFLIGADGRVFARFEAFTTEAEMEEAVKALLAAG